MRSEGARMGSENEIVAIVDENNRLIGPEPRFRMRALGLTHRAVYILVFNSNGDLFCHKRTRDKDVYPGCYDVVAGGVVLMNESYDEAAKRELEEELGIRNTLLTPLFEFFYDGPITRVWGHAYQCIYDGTMLLQKEEIESGKFCRIEDIFKSAEKDPYTPDGLYVLKRYVQETHKAEA
jgi:8-oxo-dGTP pyrophosphatase MutT (NUDIX family)